MIPDDFERVLPRLSADVKNADEDLLSQSMMAIRVHIRAHDVSADTIAAIRCDLSFTLQAVQQAEARAALIVDNPERNAA